MTVATYIYSNSVCNSIHICTQVVVLRISLGIVITVKPVISEHSDDVNQVCLSVSVYIQYSIITI